jgi:hypothetical protein
VTRLDAATSSRATINPMRRALTVAKYLPAVLCGMLVVAWVVSLWCVVGFELHWPGVGWGREGSLGVKCSGGSIRPFRAYFGSSSRLIATNRSQAISWDDLSGKRPSATKIFIRTNNIPIPFLLTCMLPLAIGPSSASASRSGRGSPSRR